MMEVLKDTTKKCTRCNQIKSLSDFYVNGNILRDGSPCYRSECKQCHIKLKVKYHQTEAGKAAKKRYYQSKKGKATRAKFDRKRDPQKVLARKMVHRAILRHKLADPKTLKCFRCNQSASQYHHHRGYDRSNRYDVLPVCKECHLIIHSSP